MSFIMITAVDTSVLLDVFTADPHFVTASQTALRQAIQVGSLSVCAMVIAEIRPCFPDRDQLTVARNTLGAKLSPFSQEAAFIAGEMWQQYRLADGKREREGIDLEVTADDGSDAFAREHGALLTREETVLTDQLR